MDLSRYCMSRSVVCLSVPCSGSHDGVSGLLLTAVIPINVKVSLWELSILHFHNTTIGHNRWNCQLLDFSPQLEIEAGIQSVTTWYPRNTDLLSSVLQNVLQCSIFLSPCMLGKVHNSYCSLHPIHAYRNGPQLAWAYSCMYLRYFLPYPLHATVGIWTHFAQEGTIWAGFVLLFFFPPDHLLGTTALCLLLFRTVRPNKENDTKEELFTAI